MRKDLQERIVQELQSKVPLQGCPMCKGGQSFGVAEGLLIHIIHEDESMNPYNMSSGSSLPTVAVVCDNCGYVMQYAVKALLKDWDEIRKQSESQ